MWANRSVRYFSRFVKKLPQLNTKEKDVLVRRLKKHTLQTIADNYSVTEARIRQIEKQALKKVGIKEYQQNLFFK